MLVVARATWRVELHGAGAGLTVEGVATVAALATEVASSAPKRTIEPIAIRVGVLTL